MKAALIRHLLDHPWLAILACLLLSAAAAAGMPRLGFSTDYRAYFSEDNPDRQAFERMEEYFPDADGVFFVLVPEDGDVFTEATLSAVRELTDRAWRLPWASSVASLSSFHQSYAEDDDVMVEPLIPDGPLDETELERIREQAVGNPRIRNGLIADDGSVTGVAAYFEPDDQDAENQTKRFAEAARGLADEIEAEYPQLTIYMTGVVMLKRAMAQSVDWDLKHLYPPFFILMFLVALAFFRSLTVTLATIAVLVMSVATAMGAAGWAGVVLTTASIGAAIIVLTLAVADCVHILWNYALARAQDLDARAAMAESLRVNLEPVFLTTVTTAVGFLGMNFSDSPPFRDLGNTVAVGVVAAMVYSIAFLPAVMVLLPKARPATRELTRSALDRLAGFVIARRRPLFYGMLVVILGLAACISMNRFGDNYIKFFDEEIPFRIATELANERLTGMQVIEYPIHSGAPNGVTDPEYLQKLDKLVQWFEAQPHVVKVSAVTHLMKRLNKTFHGGEEQWKRLPENRELAAQYLFFYEFSLPAGVDITHLVDINKSVSQVSVVLEAVPDTELVKLDERAQAWMRENLPPEMQARGASIAIMFAKIAERNFYSMLLGTALAFAFIAVAMMFAFGSVRLGLISLVPNLAPMLMGFGLWGLLVGQAGVATSVVASLTLGIVVDDTVHLLTKYRRAREELGYAPQQAIRHAFVHVGAALVLTSLVLATGFLVMTFSSFAMTAQLGSLTAIIIVFALLADFLFLPPLLLRVDVTSHKSDKPA